MSSRCCMRTSTLPIFGTESRRFFSCSNRKKSINLPLHLVTNRSCVQNEDVFINKVLRAVKGGVSCVQIRDQKGEWEETLNSIFRLKKHLKPFNVPIILNDYVEIASAIRAVDGVHLGQTDLPYCHARALMGSSAVIGLTVDSWEDVLTAQNLDVDYLGVQVFPSERTKLESKKVWGLSGLRAIRQISRHSLVAIGGVDLSNLKSVTQELDSNRDGVAMVGDLWRSDDPFEVAKKVTKNMSASLRKPRSL